MKTLYATLLALTLGMGAAFAQSPVDINSASAQEIAEALNGVGMTKAEAIVSYREQNGSFEHADQLVNVRGIGLATVEKNRDFILVAPHGD